MSLRNMPKAGERMHLRPNGEIQGDPRKIPETDHGINPPGAIDYGGSLGGMSKAAVADGYQSMGKITKDTTSDEPDFA